ncbi:MAG: glycoside hydrolase family 3 protein [Treponema sp.]|nr:glycoside hydrolase family 3 protein [Treponema sp.]
MTIKTYISIFAFSLLAGICTPFFAESASIPDTADFWSDYPHEELGDFLISKMSDDELLAQIFMFGWEGVEPSGHIKKWVSERGLGSVKVFGRNAKNTEEVAKSVTALQRLAQSHRFHIPLYVATDQEGGWIRHIKGNTSDTPGNMAIGASGYPIDAYWSAYYISREISALGINMNFAPTVDVYSNRQSTVIGPRSFSDNPEYVGELGSAFAAGSLAAGVIPTAKHFPGHGDTSLDSHGKLPEINIDMKTLEERELVPFKYLITENIPAIMSGHLSFPLILKNGEPASLSKTFLTELLRQKLGFEGLIITDDMMMNGATLFAGSMSRAFTLAIEAGNDIILSSYDTPLDEPLWEKNIELMKTDASFKEKVRMAARRVVVSKLAYFKGENAAPLYPDSASLKNRIPDPEGEKFFLNQACRSITTHKKGSMPFTQKNERILLCGQTQFPEFFEEGEKRFSRCNRFQFDYNAGPNFIEWTEDNLPALAANYDVIIFCVSDPSSARMARCLKSLNKKVIIFSVLTPVYVLDYDWADTILLGYSYSPYSFKALYGALCGDFAPKGKLPLR